jgi:hypothetical protein
MAKTKIKYRYRSKRKIRRRIKRKIPLGVTLGFGSALLGGGGLGETAVIQYALQGNVKDALFQMCKNIIGVDPADGSFSWQRIAWQPMVAGIAVSSGLGRFMNRRLNLPYIKL